jgi:hypothetical protein
MLYAITYTFKNNINEKRDAIRDEHIAHLNGAEDRLKVAGPVLHGDDSDEAYGSLIVIEAHSQTAASLFSDTDPYVTAGIVESVTIRPWKALLGVWAS